MARRVFENAAVLLFDPVKSNAQTTRSILHDLGFRRIEAIDDIKEFSDKLGQGEVDLVVAETTGQEAEICGMVRRLRSSELGANPFLVIILTSWSRQVGDVKTAIDSGADDLLLRPFSNASLEERLVTLVRARKGFIVTGDYIGPDRRKNDKRGETSVKSLEAPNTLKAVVEGGFEELQVCEEAINAAKVEVDRERIRRLGMRVATAARLRLEGAAASDAHGLEEIDRAARELRRRLRAHGGGECLSLASALTEVTARMLAGDTAEDTFELARDLALGAFAAFAGEADAQESNKEVDAVVEAVRARMKPQAVKAAG